MGLAVVNSEAGRRPQMDLDQLQLEQFKHDETYHREIARLNTQDRLKHMALHFAKYAGNLTEADGDEAVLRKTVTDTFIIAVSTANTLNFRLSAAPLVPDQDGWKKSSFARELTIHAGRMAAACEKLDHLEDFSYRPVLRESSLALVQATMREADQRDWDLVAFVQSRLAGVKHKMIFHGLV